MSLTSYRAAPPRTSYYRENHQFCQEFNREDMQANLTFFGVTFFHIYGKVIVN